MTPYERKVKPDRTAWRESQPQRCMYCHRGPDWLPLQVHEIERRSHAFNTWGNRANYLLLCQRCHEGTFANMNHAQQLAVKLVMDPEHFDLEEWLAIKPRAHTYVTWPDLRLAGS